MNYKAIGKFGKDFKKLGKKYRSLEDDLENFKKNLPFVDVYASKNFAVLHQSDKSLIIKARFFCRYLRGNSMRLIYAFYPGQDAIEFIQLYFKGDSEREDSGRIKQYLQNNF